jgi:hypothetical protein
VTERRTTRGATTLQELDEAGLDLRAWCYACMRAETIDPANVRANPTSTIAKLATRLRCRHCGSKADVAFRVAGKRGRRR